MFRFKSLLAGGLLCLTSLPPLYAFSSPAWQKISDLPVSPAEIRSTLTHPESQGILLASETRIFKKDASGKWTSLWHLPGVNNQIKKIMTFEQIPGKVFAITREGIFMGDLASEKWIPVFSATGRAKEVLSFTVLPNDPDHWFAGTASGLYDSDDAGKTWNKLERSPNASVTRILFFNERLYAAFGRQVFVSKNLESFKAVLGLPSSVKEPNELLDQELDPDLDLEESLSSVSNSAFSDLAGDDSSQAVWAASSQGVFETRDGGDRWTLLSSSGLRSKEIRFLIYAAKLKRLFAATKKEVYVYQSSENRWQELFQGMGSGTIHGLTVDEKSNEAIASTSSGILKLSLENPEMPITIPIHEIRPELSFQIKRWISLEPSAREVQKDAAQYSNLKNGKINRWHMGSRLAALLPSVSFGRDFSIGNNIDIDRGSTNERDTFIAGPDDTDRGWDFDVSWDLGDFIYSSAQTSIDSREKIMVEFRHDMLTEATRLYYERRRLQSEWINTPPQNAEEHADLMLRIDELTSHLDGMTGGRFGRKLERIAQAYPDLAGIWDGYESTEDSVRRTANG